MTIVSVAAPGNGSGKTLALAAVLGAFPGRLSAVKFTTVYRDGVNCPRTEKACACRALHGRYTVVTDPAVLSQEQTDTGRLARSGARSVLWCLAQPGAHAEAWDHLRRDLLADASAIITEGNSIVPVLDPDVLIMVMSPAVARSRWKSDTLELLRRAHHVIINAHRGQAAGAEASRDLAREASLERGGRPVAIEDVSLPLGAWRDPALREDLAARLGPPGAAPILVAGGPPRP